LLVSHPNKSPITHSTPPPTPQPPNPPTQVTWYAVLGLGFFLGLMVFRGAVLYWWCLGASQRTQAKSVHRVLYAPLGFFLTVRVWVWFMWVVVSGWFGLKHWVLSLDVGAVLVK